MHPEVSMKCTPETTVRPASLAIIAVGSNLGDRRRNMTEALIRLQDIGAGEVLTVSSLYRTNPIDTAGGQFLNAVIILKTTLAPEKLLAAIKSIEILLGRTGSRADARPVDLDILFFDDASFDSPELTIPHPRWSGRGFVVVPLAEICFNIQELFSRKPSRMFVEPLSGLPLHDAVAQRLHALQNKENGGFDNDDVAVETGPEWFPVNNVKF